MVKSAPDTSYGFLSVGLVTPKAKCTIVDLKSPDNLDGQLTVVKLCTLFFAFPTAEQAVPKKLSFSGLGHFFFKGYLTGFGADEKTTYNRQPVVGSSLLFPPVVMVPGNTYTIAELPCLILPASGGQTVSGALCRDDSASQWEQTSNGEGGCPVGFFVVVH
jgi:hypothetical protein